MAEYVKKSDVLELLSLPKDLIAEYVCDLKGLWIDDDEAEQTEPQAERVWNAGFKTGYDKGYKDAQKVKDSQDLVKDLVKEFCEDGTWLERQGVYTLTLAEAKQRAVDIIESVTQTETQNSNLTFEKDECAKEYEELGLKELKELINADRKTENCSEIPNNCDTCRNKGFEGCEQPCLGCGCCGLYEPKDEPQTMLNDGTLVINVEDATKVGRVLVGDDKNRGGLYYPDYEDESQTEKEGKR